jgi:hypothetical protein
MVQNLANRHDGERLRPVYDAEGCDAFYFSAINLSLIVTEERLQYTIEDYLRRIASLYADDRLYNWAVAHTLLGIGYIGGFWAIKADISNVNFNSRRLVYAALMHGIFTVKVYRKDTCELNQRNREEFRLYCSEYGYDKYDPVVQVCYKQRSRRDSLIVTDGTIPCYGSPLCTLNKFESWCIENFRLVLKERNASYVNKNVIAEALNYAQLLGFTTEEKNDCPSSQWDEFTVAVALSDIFGYSQVWRHEQACIAGAV